MNLRRIKSVSVQQEFSVLVVDIFYCTEYVSTTQRDTVRLHPSISFLFPLCPAAGKGEHLNMMIIFIMNTEKKNNSCLFTYFDCF